MMLNSSSRVGNGAFHLELPPLLILRGQVNTGHDWLLKCDYRFNNMVLEGRVSVPYSHCPPLDMDFASKLRFLEWTFQIDKEKTEAVCFRITLAGGHLENFVNFIQRFNS